MANPGEAVETAMAAWQAGRCDEAKSTAVSNACEMLRLFAIAGSDAGVPRFPPQDPELHMHFADLCHVAGACLPFCREQVGPGDVTKLLSQLGQQEAQSHTSTSALQQSLLRTSLVNYEHWCTGIDEVKKKDSNERDLARANLIMQAETHARLGQYTESVRCWQRVAYEFHPNADRSRSSSSPEGDCSAISRSFADMDIAPFAIRHEAAQLEILNRSADAAELRQLIRDERERVNFDDAASLASARTAWACKSCTWDAVALLSQGSEDEGDLSENEAAQRLQAILDPDAESQRLQRTKVCRLPLRVQHLLQRLRVGAPCDNMQRQTGAGPREAKALSLRDLQSHSRNWPELQSSDNAVPTSALSPKAASEWARLCHQFRNSEFKTAVVDDFFSPPVLQELLRFSQEARVFHTQRAGFLGAFPGDGASHPLLPDIAAEMERSDVLGEILKGNSPDEEDQQITHPLGNWWLFKYVPNGTEGRLAVKEDEPGGSKQQKCTAKWERGIGVHADPAAVNVNIWLTPDEGCLQGGGLEIFAHTPSDGKGEGNDMFSTKFNREFSTKDEERKFIEDVLKRGSSSGSGSKGSKIIPYRQNRAVIFKGDRWHCSEPFVFDDEYKLWRCNLTFLFGDRVIEEPGNTSTNLRAASVSPRGTPSTAESPGVSAAADDDAWDECFDSD